MDSVETGTPRHDGTRSAGAGHDGGRRRAGSRRRRLRTVVAGVAAVGVVVTAPGPAAGAADLTDGAPAPAPAAAPASAPAPVPAPTRDLTWGDCPAGSQTGPATRCADVTVPRDPAHPDAGTITLTVSRIPAEGGPAERRGVIAGNPGGPGGDALGMFAAPDGSRPVDLPEEVRRRYDLIAVEPRGLAWGTPLDCSGGPSEVLAAAGAPAQVVAMSATGGAVHAACERNQPGYVDTITTDNTARDLDRVREALGEDHLNLYGVSYGTLLMGTYATLFPQHTGRVILDSPMVPGDRWFGVGESRRALRSETIANFFAWVAERDDDYHLGTTPLQVYRHWLDRVREESGMTGALTPPPAQAGDVAPLEGAVGDAAVAVIDAVAPALWRSGTAFDAARAAAGEEPTMSMMSAVMMTAVLYKEESWPQVAELIRDGLPGADGDGDGDGEPGGDEPGEPGGDEPGEPGEPGGDGGPGGGEAEPTPEEQEAAQRMQTGLELVDLAVSCNENQVVPRQDRVAPALVANLTGGDMIAMNEDLLSSGIRCAGWPVPSTATQLDGSALDTPPLILGYTRDSAVTGAGVEAMRAVVGGDTVVLDGSSHGVLSNNPDEVADRVTGYMTS
ncbi:alpha/beta fold hydrolase [Corynebacterium bovis]|uniref:alpha/beta fold hydrolase n=1 Tax=Corynebacterium bovis TaxID=36808 RepID=UPI0024480C7C|nr:alpha/beta fold hydrolase [Corynebacterium bovis]MDH2456429.1 alpha/beta fold hydrolase [Corynebacterium bovis]